MAGFGYEELLRKARAGKRPDSSPIPAQVPVAEAEHPSGTPLTSAAKRGRQEGSSRDVDPPTKRSKGKEPLHRETIRRPSSHLDLEHLTDADMERLKMDPLLFAADIARAGSRLLAKLKQGEEERTAGMALYAKNLWLEGDNLDKTDKLTRAYDHISELRQQLEAAKRKAEEAEAALKGERESFKEVEKQRDTAVTNCSRVEEELRVEREKSEDLGVKLARSEERAERAEKESERSKEDFDRLIQSTLDLCQERFGEALRQVQYVYPHYEIDHNIIKPDHTLVNGRIIIPEQRDSEGNLVSGEVVIFDRSA